MGKPEGKRPLRKPRHRCEDNIEIDLREAGWGGMVWVHMAEDGEHWRVVVNTIINFRAP
jgi:hypothetical protein